MSAGAPTPNETAAQPDDSRAAQPDDSGAARWGEPGRRAGRKPEGEAGRRAGRKPEGEAGCRPGREPEAEAAQPDPPASSPPPAGEAHHASLQRLLDELPEDLAAQVFTHASWTVRRSDSYERLAFLGDAVLELAITTHLYPRLEAERFGAGRLTKIRAQAVSGRSCAAVAERLGVPELLHAAAPQGAGPNLSALVRTERVLASVIEAVIGACYLAFGYDRTAAAVGEAFEPEVADALENPVDFKSALQEQLAQRGEIVRYVVVSEEGPPHDRVFSVSALVGGVEVGRGSGRSKKDAEQDAAHAALEATEP